MSTQTLNISKGRGYEMVTQAEFNTLTPTSVVHVDVYRALRDMEDCKPGEGMKIKLYGTKSENERKRNAAISAATGRNIPIETRIFDGWLYLKRRRDWK